jgi:hypothetical protein
MAAPVENMTAAIKASLCFVAAAATPTIKLAVEMMPSLPRAPPLPADAADEVVLQMLAKTAHAIRPIRSARAPKE